MAMVLESYGATVSERTGWTKICCPLHDDKHASAGFNADEQVFTCFTCDIAGDVYTLIMKKEGVGFRDAVKIGENFTDRRVRPVYGSDHSGLLGIPRGSGHHAGSRRYIPPRNLR